MNNTLSLSRLSLLIRKYLIEGYMVHLMSVVGLAGSLFIILYTIHFIKYPMDMDQDVRKGIFSFIFIGGGFLYLGSSFSSLRSKEKTIAYLLIPASRVEKFVLEYISRVVPFILLVPCIFWLVSNAELAFASTLHHRLDYTYQSFLMLPEFGSPWNNLSSFREYRLLALGVLMIFNIGFLGSTIFMKQPVIKTLFSVGTIFLFNALLITILLFLFDLELYGNVFNFQNDVFLFPRGKENTLNFFTAVFVLVNLILVPTSYLKLKEKEV